jgi:hypothetical protein
MAGFAKVVGINSILPAVTPDGDYNVEILFQLMDPVLQYDGVHYARLTATTAVLPGSAPATHYDVVLAAVIAAAAALDFNVTENRCSLPVFDGDGQRFKQSRDVPVTGFDITIGNNIDHLLLEPAATLAGGTIRMPANVSDRQIVSFSSTQQITALTLLPNGTSTMPNPITTLAAGGFAYYMYRATQDRWYRVG